MKPTKRVEIVLGILEQDGKILLLHRCDKEPIWDKKWEFPGGKIEAEEPATDAICREVFEETGLQVTAHEFLLNHKHLWDLEHKFIEVHIHLYRCEVEGLNVCIEPQHAYDSRWVTVEEAYQMDMLEANADMLRLVYGQEESLS